MYMLVFNVSSAPSDKNGKYARPVYPFLINYARIAGITAGRNTC